MEAPGDSDRIEPLGPQTWDAFADLAERHDGVWGGCSRLGFTYERPQGTGNGVRSAVVIAS